MSESKTPMLNTSLAYQCPVCYNFENHQEGCRIGTLELELNEALKWKNEDPRMLREQIKVADNAFNGMTERYNKLEAQLTTAQQEIAELKRDKERLERALDKIGFYHAGTDHNHISELVLKVLKGADTDSAMKGTKE